MEKEGLQRVLTFLQQEKLTIEVLVTDRHKQINKWLRESYPSIIHYYDVWHVAKGEMNLVVGLFRERGGGFRQVWGRSPPPPP